MSNSIPNMLQSLRHARVWSPRMTSPFAPLTMALMLVVGSGSPAFANKGVFNPAAAPFDIFTATPTPVRVTAEVGSENLYITSVLLYRTTADGRLLSPVGTMFDDGSHGDL